MSKNYCEGIFNIVKFQVSKEETAVFAKTRVKNQNFKTCNCYGGHLSEIYEINDEIQNRKTRIKHKEIQSHTLLKGSDVLIQN